MNLLRALYERVILSYKSTLIGIGLAVLTEVAAYLDALPANWAHVVAAVLVVVLGLFKGSVSPPAAPSAK